MAVSITVADPATFNDGDLGIMANEDRSWTKNQVIILRKCLEGKYGDLDDVSPKLLVDPKAEFGTQMSAGVVAAEIKALPDAIPSIDTLVSFATDGFWNFVCKLDAEHPDIGAVADEQFAAAIADLKRTDLWDFGGDGDWEELPIEGLTHPH